jgi:hypothetical protein
MIRAHRSGPYLKECSRCGFFFLINPLRPLAWCFDRRQKGFASLSMRFGSVKRRLWSYGALGLYLPYRHVADGYLGLV